MRDLLKGNWMKNTVTDEEVNAFDPALGQCCDPTHWRVHLEGTPCNPWNKSATFVFVNDFIVAHPEYNRDDRSIRDMIHMKSKSALDSMIRTYRKSKIPPTVNEPEDEDQKQRNRRERKRKVSTAISVSSFPQIVTGHASFTFAAAT